MMIRRIVKTKYWFCAAGPWIAAFAAQAGDSGFLWSVRDPAGTPRAYLVGTVHLCSAACYPLPLAVREAFARRRLLALVLDPAVPSIGPLLNRAGMSAEGVAGLSRRLPAQKRQALVDWPVVQTSNLSRWRP